MQILRDLFDPCADESAILKRDANLCRRFIAALMRLVPNRIGRSRQLMKWQEDWDGNAPDQHHRHLSHLYALHPSHQINRDNTPALAAAARRSLEWRSDASTGWGLAWSTNLWARLGDGDRAHKVLEALLSSPRTYPNLFRWCERNNRNAGAQSRRFDRNPARPAKRLALRITPRHPSPRRSRARHRVERRATKGVRNSRSLERQTHDSVWFSCERDNAPSRTNPAFHRSRSLDRVNCQERVTI